MRKEKQRVPTAAEDMAVMRRAVERAMADKEAARQGAAGGSSPRHDPETDADLFRFDLAYRLRARICVSPRRCEYHRCRRLGRCRELLKIGRLTERHRARMQAAADRVVKPQRNH